MSDAKPGFRTRPYRPADLEGCLAVFDANTPTAFHVDEREDFAAFLHALPGPYVVIENAGEAIVGCGGWAFEPDGETVSLCWGMVAPSHQGRGLGRGLLIERMEAAWADDRCQAIRLETTPDTHGFFVKRGFSVVATRKDGFGPGLDAVEMVARRRP